MSNGETEKITFQHQGNSYSITVPKGLDNAGVYDWAMKNNAKFAALGLPRPGGKQPQPDKLNPPPLMESMPRNMGVKPAPSLGQDVRQSLPSGPGAVGEALARHTPTPSGKVPGTGVSVDEAMYRAGEFATMAGSEALALAGPETGLGKAIPSASRAGATIGRIEQAAKGDAVHMHGVTDIVARARELEQRGHYLPKVFKDMETALAKASQVDEQGGTKPFLGFKEARDFFSSAGRIADAEYGQMTPVMKRQAVDLYLTMGKRIDEAVARLGPKAAEEFKGALKEYRQAKVLSEKAATIVDIAWKAILAGAVGGAAAKHIYKFVP